MEQHPIWLDTLPLDVVVRIAASTQASNLRSAKVLANASPTQRTAFLRAIKYKLDLPKISFQCVGDVVQIETHYQSLTPSHTHSPTLSHHSSASCSHDPRDTSSDLDHHSHSDTDEHTCSNHQGSNSSHHHLISHSSDTASEHTAIDSETHSHLDDQNEHRADTENETVSGDETEGSSDDQQEQQSNNTNDTPSNHETNSPSDTDHENPSENSSEIASSHHTRSNSNASLGMSPNDAAEELHKRIAIPFQTDYADLLNHHVREIFIDGQHTDIFNEPSIQSCLTSTSLLNLNIRLLPSGMESIQYGSNIRSLELLLDECDLLTLLRNFSSLQLRQLKVRTTGDKCFHDYLSNDPESHSLLAHLFPQVEVLSLACASCGELEEGPPWYLWNVIEKFSKLKEVTLSEGVPDNAIDRLREMERITLIAGDISKLVKKIPDRLISVSTSRIWPQLFSRRIVPCEHDFEPLEYCVKLEELNCVMMPGAESGLLPIVRNLRTLGIAFASVEREEDSWGTAPEPLEPKEGVLLDVVKSAPFLESLRLVNMRIRRCELREILTTTGNRLEEYEEEVFVEQWRDQFFSHGGVFMFQKKDNKFELEELTKILRTAALNNSKLKKFKLDVRAGWFTDMNAVLSTLPKLKASFEVLQRHAVGLDARSLKEMMIKFETGCFGMIDMMMSFGIPGVAVPFMEL